MKYCVDSRSEQFNQVCSGMSLECWIFVDLTSPVASMRGSNLVLHNIQPLRGCVPNIGTGLDHSPICPAVCVLFPQAILGLFYEVTILSPEEAGVRACRKRDLTHSTALIYRFWHKVPCGCLLLLQWSLKTYILHFTSIQYLLFTQVN